MSNIRELPAILYISSFVPVGTSFQFEARTRQTNAILNVLAKGVLNDQNDAKRFIGNFVLIAYHDRNAGVSRIPKIIKGDYKNIVFETRINFCRRIGENRWLLDVTALRRVKLIEFTQLHPHYLVKIDDVAEYNKNSAAAKEKKKKIVSLIEDMVKNHAVHRERLVYCAEENNLPHLADNLVFNWPFRDELECFSKTELRKLAGTLDVAERLRMIVEKIENVMQTRHEKGMPNRRFILLKQQREIKAELKKLDPKEDFGAAKDDTEEMFAERIEKSGMTQEANDIAQKELRRLVDIPPHNPEYEKSITYLEWLCDLPWSAATEDNLDIGNAREILNQDHYGLEKVKEAIVGFLAVRKLKPDKKGDILCFVGPPGVGKTSLGKSIARAMNRKFTRMSLGGVRDEAEIRGHRRTYISALPGRIIQGMKKAGSKNPVFLLDEIDKLASDFRGDPSSALLEVLDSEQNQFFSDHYLEVAFSLAQVMFITTANELSPIRPALRDRLHVVELPGYTSREKLQIARHFLLPKQIEENGVTGHLEIPDETVAAIIANYTREAGVRNLEREIAAICRSVAVDIDSLPHVKKIDAVGLNDILGPPRYEKIQKVDRLMPGVVTGLVKSGVGGDTLLIEVAVLKSGKESEFICTGQAAGQSGDLTREAARWAFSYAQIFLLREGLIKERLDSKYDIHINFSSGNAANDGPALSGAICLAIISAVLKKTVSPKFAMCAEFTFREDGKLLPVNGLKDRLLAAFEADYRDIYIPELNFTRDLEEIPQEIKDGLNIMPAENIEEVIAFTLGV